MPPRSQGSATRGFVTLVSSDEILRLELEAQLVTECVHVDSRPSLPAVPPSYGEEVVCCVVLDSGSSAFREDEMQQVLAGKDYPPIIIIGSGNDIRATVRAIKSGAYDYIPKPCDLTALLDSVRGALTHDRRLQVRRIEQQLLAKRYHLLTAREREVLPLVVGGLLNKQSASILGISEITLQIHRGQVMRKMQANSLADLVRMAMKLKLPYWDISKPQNDVASNSSWHDNKNCSQGALGGRVTTAFDLVGTASGSTCVLPSGSALTSEKAPLVERRA